MAKSKNLKGKVNSSPLDPKLIVWNQGFNAGAKQQRKSDVENLVSLLENSTEISGIGEKVAWKIQNHVLEKFGKDESHEAT